jgi:hypothetical protein
MGRNIIVPVYVASLLSWLMTPLSSSLEKKRRITKTWRGAVSYCRAYFPWTAYAVFYHADKECQQ